MQETQVQSLGQEDPLAEEMVILPSILAWKIPWAKEPGRLLSMELQKQSDTTYQLNNSNKIITVNQFEKGCHLNNSKTYNFLFASSVLNINEQPQANLVFPGHTLLSLLV